MFSDKVVAKVTPGTFSKSSQLPTFHKYCSSMISIFFFHFAILAIFRRHLAMFDLFSQAIMRVDKTYEKAVISTRQCICKKVDFYLRESI